MASTAVATWTACVTGLQGFVDNALTTPQRAQLMLHISQISNLQSPLPNAAMKKLVHEGQVMRKLAALCIQAHQQNAPLSTQNVVLGVLGVWLYDAQSACASSPQSRLAASARQQLQESGMMQHMDAILADAAEELTAAAAVTDQEAVSGSSSSSSSSSSRGGSKGGQEAAQKYSKALVLVQEVLQVLVRSCEVFSTKASISLESALPAAPAAVRLILTTFQTCSKVQQPAGVLLATDTQCQQRCASCLGTAHHVLLRLAEAVDGQRTPSDSASNLLLSLPGVRELLLCPDLVPCLALGVLVAMLGLNTGAQEAATNSSVTPNAVGTAATRSSSSTGRTGSRTGSRRGPGQASRSQGPLASQGSASTQSNLTSSGRLGNGISLDSLTPLSRGLFGVLGVDQGVLLQAVSGGGVFKTSDAAGFAPDYVDRLLGVYTYLMSFQVEQLSTPGGPSITQLLLHAETDMLLTLAVHQLTASIPASYPGAHEARQTGCDLRCYVLSCLFNRSSLHMLPLPAAYTGPQLALQVTPCTLGQQQHQQQQQWHTVTPTVQMLTELLPLLTSYCLAMVQQQCQQRQQLLQGLQHANGQGQGPAHLLSILRAMDGFVCPDSLRLWIVRSCMSNMCTLLACALIPHPNLTPAEKQATVGVACTEPPVRGLFPYRCGVQAHDVVLQNAGDILRLCEALLRDAAAMCETAAQLHNANGAAAAACTATQLLTASLLTGAEDSLGWIAGYIAAFVHHKVTGGLPHHPAALVVAALSAGPGSNLQQQLFSLLCSMVKLGHTPIPANLPKSTAEQSQTARSNLSRVAAVTATGLLADAADMQQPCLPDVMGDSHAAVLSQLPALFILGRSCMRWAQEYGSQAADTPKEAAHMLVSRQSYITEHILPAVQQWLQASSTLEQLVAAGYAPQALPQQLQQVITAVQPVWARVLQVSFGASSGNNDTASLQEFAQQLQAAGKALCSFAVPCLCNNPSCANLSGLTEMGLVSGRSCVCGGCRAARYCGRPCQRSVWKEHKPVCAALAAAAASTAAGTAVSALPIGP